MMTNPTQQDDDLQQKLQQAQDAAEQKKQSDDSTDASHHDEQIKHLEAQLAEKDEIAKKAQHDYISLKMDFDGYMTRHENQKKQDKISTLLDVAKKFLPLVQSLNKTIQNIPEDQQESALAQGVSMTYKTALTQLEAMAIYPIESLGLAPDATLHEPLTTQPVQEEEMKGKIIQEYEQGFVYRKDGEQKVIITSKVVVGA